MPSNGKNINTAMIPMDVILRASRTPAESLFLFFRILTNFRLAAQLTQNGKRKKINIIIEKVLPAKFLIDKKLVNLT